MAIPVFEQDVDEIKILELQKSKKVDVLFFSMRIFTFVCPNISGKL